MDDPLIMNAGGSSSSKILYGRADAIAYGNRYQRAAALVDLAEDGIGLPEELIDPTKFGQAAKFYFIFIKFDLLWSLNLLALILLNFFEVPLWCSSNPCSDRKYYFLGDLPYLTANQSLIYELITLCILAVHTFFPISYTGFKLFRKNSLNILKVILLGLLVIDLIFDILYITSGPISYLPLRIAPYIRVLFLLANIRELRDCVWSLTGMVAVYLDVLALMVLFLLFSSWLAYIMFEDTKQGKLIFTSYGETLCQMFVLFTTSNNPDVWIPAYKSSRISCLFFMLYILFGVYFVTNLILAVVYDSFKKQLAKQVAEMDKMRNRTLETAFTLLDENKCGFLDKDQCAELFQALNMYRTLPKISKEDFDCIFYELDDSHDFKINKEEFADLCDAISLRFEKELVPSCFETYPFYHSTPCNCLRNFVKGKMFDYIIIFMLFLNLITIIIETTLDIQNDADQYIWQTVEICFGWLYVVEMLLKIFSYGFDAYWREGQNRFDFTITWIIVIGETLNLAFPHGLPILSNAEWIRYLLIARLLRLTRILIRIPRYSGIMATFFTLIPSLTSYIGLIFCVMCLYCSLGSQLFGGLVYEGNPMLEGTTLLENDYLVFNFNDYPSGMVTLFNLMVMGNWQIWMESYVKLTGTSWTLIYFISYYVITVLLLVNLVVAFVLEAFFAQSELETSSRDVETDQSNSKDSKDSQSRRARRISSTGRSGRVQMLLHRILSAELEENCA
uniref:ATCCH1 fatty acid oxygenation upregulated 2 n=1 Tax=Juniperus scopulorum TaxID=466205 RepID=A0A3Q8BQ03_JUNSC|nr:ATCCH1 fatty acid oxygenation upregulated 2 [Juniperus scopulorum]